MELTNNGNMESERGGLHFIEIHLPTVNAGIVTVVILVAFGVGLWFLGRCVRRRMLKYEERELRRVRERDLERGRPPPSAPSESRELVRYVPRSQAEPQLAVGPGYLPPVYAPAAPTAPPPPPPQSPARRNRRAQGSRATLAEMMPALFAYFDGNSDDDDRDAARGGDGRSRRRAYDV